MSIDTEDLVVTGCGAVSPMGSGTNALWSGVVAGRLAATEVAIGDQFGCPTRWAAVLPAQTDAAVRELAAAARVSRVAAMATMSSFEALRDAGFEGRMEHLRVALLVASVFGDRDSVTSSELSPRGVSDATHRMVRDVRRMVTASGPCAAIQAACASGNAAVEVAATLLKDPRLDAALVVGVDNVSEATFLIMSSFRSLANGHARPFDRERTGFVPGEGSGALVIERRSDAGRRRRSGRARIVGGWSFSDAHHLTAPHPTGRGLARALQIAAAKAHPNQIAYINAHGTGTQSNDLAEAGALNLVFGAGPAAPAVSSIKGMIGHTNGAANILEAIVTIKALEAQILPPNPTLLTPDPLCEIRLAERTAGVLVGDFAISNALGFGGQASALLLSRCA